MVLGFILNVIKPCYSYSNTCVIPVHYYYPWTTAAWASRVDFLVPAGENLRGLEARVPADLVVSPLPLLLGERPLWHPEG